MFSHIWEQPRGQFIAFSYTQQHIMMFTVDVGEPCRALHHVFSTRIPPQRALHRVFSYWGSLEATLLHFHAHSITSYFLECRGTLQGTASRIIHWKGTLEGTFSHFIYLRRMALNFLDSDEFELAGDLRKALAPGQVDSWIVEQIGQAHLIPCAQTTLRRCILR